MMLGTFVSDDGINNPMNNIGQRSNREVTLRKAKEAIRHLWRVFKISNIQNLSP